MKLYYDKRLSNPTYYVQVGFRKNGKATTKNIEKIGKHNDLLKEHNDPLAYAKEYVKKLNEEQDISRITLTCNLKKKLDASEDLISKSTTTNIGYLVLNSLYQKLELGTFFTNIEDRSRFTFDAALINRILTFDRILNPRSKYQTVYNLNDFFEQPAFEYQHVLRFMDVLAKNYDEYISHLYKYSNKIIKRDTTICYYDCTNYYFEIERADEDIIDEVTGEVLEGFRRFALSKDHKPNPVVQMGLFMDKDGIPLSMCLTKGNTQEQLTALPLEEKLIKSIDTNNLIYCADAGLGSYNIRKFNSLGGRKFIVTQSLKKLPDILKEAVFNDYDYRLLSNDKNVSIDTLKQFDPFSNAELYNDKAYKVIDASKELVMSFLEEKTLSNGKTKKVKAKATLGQKIIVTFSRKMMEYQRSVRNSQIQRAMNALKNIDPENFKKGPNDFRRFIKKDNTKKDSYIIDEVRIREEEKYDGYYLIATNIQDLSVKEILHLSSNRYKIEECFRIIKTDFDGRPIYHHLEDRIKAHFLICYTSLLIYRILETKLNRNGTHLTTSQIIKTLKNMNVVEIDGVIYKSLYTNSHALKSILEVTDLPLDHEYYLKNNLTKLCK